MCDIAYQALSQLLQQWEGPGDEARLLLGDKFVYDGLIAVLWQGEKEALWRRKQKGIVRRQEGIVREEAERNGYIHTTGGGVCL